MSQMQSVRTMWDSVGFEVQKDLVIEARRPDMIVTDKKNNICKIIDLAVPYYNRVDAEEVENIEQYQDLARELRNVWNKRLKVKPMIF